MTNHGRIYTYVKALGKPPVLATFSTCLVKALSGNPDLDETWVDVSLDASRLILSNNSQGYPMQHFTACPMRHLTENQKSKIPQNILDRNIGAAVSILLESSDKKVLLTRRPSHMRTFPNIWVPPGGSIDPQDASLLDAGLRELEEEVNLSIDRSQVQNSSPLCLWESVYPTTLKKGEPKRQHCVVYFHIKVEKHSKELQREVKLQADEVGACSWLNRPLVDLAIGETPKPESVPEHFDVYQLNPDSGECDLVRKSSKVLSAQFDGSTESDVERLSSGTIFALQRWTEIQ